MGKLILLLIFALLPLTSVAGQEVVEISVDGMVCEFCVYGVKKKLKKLEGIQNVEVSLEDKRARIVMEPDQSANIDNIRDAISDAGFSPGEATSTTK